MPDVPEAIGRSPMDERLGTAAYEGLGYVFLASLAFCAVVYASGAFLLLWNVDLFEKSGTGADGVSWGVVVTFFFAAACAYAACLGLCRVLVPRQKHGQPEDGGFADRLAHRTGMQRVELLTTIAAVVAVVLTLVAGWRFLPLALAALAPVALAAANEPYRRRVGVTPAIFVPPGLPPMNLTPLPDLVPSEPLPDGYELVTYRWRYALGLSRWDNFEVALPINVGLYHEFCSMNTSQADVGQPGANPYYSRAVLGMTSEIRRLAEMVRSLAVQRSYGTLDEIGIAYSFVQDEDNMPYTRDAETKGRQDYWRYPLETLYERTGDCECKSIFLASLLVTLGYSTVVFEIPPRPGSNAGHTAVGVEAPRGVSGNFAAVNGRRYFYLETTASGWQLGELPPDIDGEGITAWPLTVKA